MIKCIFEDFKYQKAEGEIKEHSLLILDSDDKHRKGIDLKLLTEEEQKIVIQLQKDYEEKMSPFVKKAYRTFLIDKIVGEI